MTNNELQLKDILKEIIAKSHSHLDGRFLFEPLLDRKRLDILKRLDGVETWHEADWLTALGETIKKAQLLLKVQDDK